MAPMKAMKAKKAMKGSMKAKGGAALTKTALAQALADQTELKRSEVSKVLDSLAGVAAEQVKKVEKCIIPGVGILNTRVESAMKAGKREIFGMVVVVQMMKAQCIVKTFPMAASRSREMLDKVAVILAMKAQIVDKASLVAALTIRGS